MIRTCDVCGQKLSHYEKKCPNCGAKQHSTKIIRTAGRVVRRLIGPLVGRFGKSNRKR